MGSMSVNATTMKNNPLYSRCNPVRREKGSSGRHLQGLGMNTGSERPSPCRSCRTSVAGRSLRRR